MARKLFGTDGVRGVAGEFLTAELALGLARAATAARAVEPTAGAGHPRHPRVGRDARGGGRRRASSAAGGDALLGGVLPTPAAPLLLAPLRASTSRSCSRPRTTPTATTASSSSAATATSSPTRPSCEIERALERRRSARRGRRSAACASCAGAAEDYLRELHTRFERARPRGIDVLLDCANGATYQRRARDLPAARGDASRCSPASPTGATSTTAAARPTSSSSPRWSRAGGHQLGFAFDGDGDRVLAVDARRRRRRRRRAARARRRCTCASTGRLSGDGVVVTVMTNYGFHAAMSARRRRQGRDDAVGDRYVLEELRASGWTLGGEQSGHLIEMGFNRTGDGIAGALLTLEALGGARPRRAPRDEQAAPAPRQRARARPRRDRRRRRRARGGARRRGRARGPRPRADPPQRHRAARARDGRGADAPRRPIAICGRLVALVEAELGA